MANVTPVDSFGGADIQELLSVNDLTYLADNQSNIVTERSQKLTYSQKTSYKAGEVIVMQLNSGSDYLSWMDSSLRILLKTTQVATGDATGWGGGSVLNLFENIRIISRSGVVITEINKLNLWNYYNLKLSHTVEWRKNQQGRKLLGVGVDLTPAGVDEFIIPLRDLCPFFSDDILAPASLTAGIRVECTLGSVNTVFKGLDVAINPVTAYEVSGIQLNLDSYRLSAGAMSALNSMAASSGLVLTFPDINNSKFAKNLDATSFSAEVRQAVSQANQVYTSVRETANVDLLTKDSFATIAPTADSSYQYRVASIYLPQTAVVGIKQYYSQLSYVRSDMKTGGELGIVDAVGANDESDKNALACATIARYSTRGSGMALNASTSLNLQMNVATPASDVDVFLMHTKRVVVFLENVVVSE
jgi:hypothetical protein